jgi:hypothetical protein
MGDLAASLMPEPSAGAGFRSAVWGALRRLSWRVVGGTLAITVALDVWVLFDTAYASGSPRLPAAERFASGAIINLLMAFYIMLATLAADEFVARGARRLRAYSSAVVIGAAAGALVQWAVHRWLHLRTEFGTDVLREVTLVQPPIVFFEYLIWGSLIVFLYVNRRTALLATARMNAAQLQRTEAQRRTLESQLQALQARVEPQFLFNTLARVRGLNESDPANGSRMLDELIVYLRAALPQLRDSASTLGQELTLVWAYLSILRASLGKPLLFDVDASAAGLAARVPPMLLLPLINDALTASRYDNEIRVAAHIAGNMLRVEISDGACCLVRDPGDSLREIEQRLQGLYAGRGTLTVEPAGSLGSRR